MATRWHTLSSEEAMSASIAERIVTFSDRCIREAGRFSIVLTGGKSIRPVYQKLALASTDWRAWHVFWGDERCVSADHEQRNSKLAIDTWLSRMPIPIQQIHPIPAELGPIDATHQYDQLLSAWSTFDLVLLSLGQDGHVASLFPGQEVGSHPETPAVLSTLAPPDHPVSERVSLSAWRLSMTRQMFIVAWGSSKALAVDAWQKDADLPITKLTAHCGVDVWY